MKVLELFAGSRSIGRIAERSGADVFSVDINAFDGIDLVADILTVTKEQIPFMPDVIWASPPCTTYSIAAISHHRDGYKPKSKDAKNADRVLEKTLEILSWFPDAKYFVENPVGMMRKMPVMQNLDRATVTYCSYGDSRMKPTDIWSNHIADIFTPNAWQPRAKCWNGNRQCQHEAAPRGSRTGTQGLKNAYERSKIPAPLVEEILECLTKE